MRLFFAIKAPNHTELHALHDRLSHISRLLKPVHPEKQHITLRFLGEVREPLKSVIEVGSRCVGSIEPFEMRIKGSGAFPNWRRPSAIWIGFEGGEMLKDMVADLEDALVDDIDTPREKRPFRVHLTVARVKGYLGENIQGVKGAVENSVERLRADGYTIPVAGYDLIRSTLTPAGPLYEVMHSYILQKEG